MHSGPPNPRRFAPWSTRLRAAALLVALTGACQGAGNGTEAAQPARAAAPAGEGAEARGNEQRPEADAPVAPGKRTPGAATDVTLSTSDATKVFARFEPALSPGASPPSLLLLFHQAGSNRAEYEPTVRWLSELGYATLSVDQRSGGTMWSRENPTVAALGESTGFAEAYPDMVAALDWAQASGFEKILAVGSSYSAALVFRLGAERGDDLRGIAAFSPGEYLEPATQVGAWAQRIEIPTFVSSSPKEYTDARKLMEKVSAEQKLQHRPKQGVHGASSLRPDTNPDGHEEYRAMLKAFLETAL